MSATGNFSTVAGNSSCSDTGDGGPATSASLQPYALAVDSSGDVYIANGTTTGGTGCEVREVYATTGQIVGVAGNGACGNTVDGNTATSSEIEPSGLTIGPGNALIVSDAVHCVVDEIIPNGGVNVAAQNSPATTFAGNGTCGKSGDGGSSLDAELNFPVGVAADSSGSVFVADQENFDIRKVAAGSSSLYCGYVKCGLIGSLRSHSPAPRERSPLQHRTPAKRGKTEDGLSVHLFLTEKQPSPKEQYEKAL